MKRKLHNREEKGKEEVGTGEGKVKQMLTGQWWRASGWEAQKQSSLKTDNLFWTKGTTWRGKRNPMALVSSARQRRIGKEANKTTVKKLQRRIWRGNMHAEGNRRRGFPFSRNQTEEKISGRKESPQELLGISEDLNELRQFFPLFLSTCTQHLSTSKKDNLQSVHKAAKSIFSSFSHRWKGDYISSVLSRIEKTYIFYLFLLRVTAMLKPVQLLLPWDS